MEWQKIDTVPSGEWVIGLRPVGSGRSPAFIGKRYDGVPDAMLNGFTGRWAVCTHWMPLPPPPALPE